MFTLGKHLNTLSFTITYTQDNATTQNSALSAASWASRLPRMSISSRAGLTKSKKGKIGPISAPHDGRPLNSDTLRAGGPISSSAIGRQEVNVDTAPEAARRREIRQHGVEDVRVEEEKESDGTNEETLEEKINQGQEAWREGDNIIIEDEEGEVIRTITSRRKHPSQVAGDKFGKAAMDRVESAGDKPTEEVEGIAGRLKRMWSGRKDSDREDRRKPDLEQGIPEDSDNPETSEKLRTSVESSKASMKHSPAKSPSGPVFIVGEDNRQTSHISDTTERRAREERDKETEVERRRREAVFGGIKNDSDDEEGSHHHYPPAVSRNKGKHPESSSDDDDSDDEQDGCQGSQNQSSSGRPESSGSVVSPPPKRARGIRFGDINVGEESFSLAEGPPSTGARHHKTRSGDWRVRWRTDNNK